MAHDVKRRFNKQINTFGSIVRKVRMSKGISQEVLSVKSNVVYSSINKIENGQINTTIGAVFALAKALGISPKDFFD